MKFRYKVMLWNMVLLSLSLGVVGYLMIRKNFTLARDSALQNAIVENNLIQSSVEYELLRLLNEEDEPQLLNALGEIGQQVERQLLSTGTVFRIYYGREIVFAGEEEFWQVDKLLENMKAGQKNYIIVENAKRHYMEITSYAVVEDEELCIVSRWDATQVYDMLHAQIGYFRIVLLLVLIAASAIMYGISRRLTGPLEELHRKTDEISKGRYDTRADVTSSDEVGELAERFNRMAEAIGEHVAELEEMVHRRDQFVADFTHEIKTPMTAIIGYADTMRSIELTKEEQMMSLNYIFKEGRRLEAMAGKLFELIYLRGNEISLAPVHVKNVVREAREVMSPLLSQKHQTLRIDVENAVLSGNRELLVTALVNLVDNARKASDEGMEIEITGHAEEERYRLCVIDHGIGMSEEDAKRICDEFYMVDKSRSRKEGGAGIGMSLVAVILEHHKAELQIDSTPGIGTSMQILFPLERKEAADEEEM